MQLTSLSTHQTTPIDLARTSISPAGLEDSGSDDAADEEIMEFDGDEDHGTAKRRDITDFLVPVTGDNKRQGDIIKHGAVKQQVMLLENKTDLAADVGDAALAEARDVLAINEDLAAAGVFYQGNQF